MRSRALGLLAGYAADRLLADPRRLHPVAGFGTVATALERRWYADRRVTGASYAATLVGGAVVLGALAELAGRRRPLVGALVTAVATWTVLGGRSLEREARRIERHLADGDVPGARERLPHLVGRDPRGLDEPEIARAVVESVAENTADAVVAPLLWGAVAGVPGLLGYRAANTLDAMVGHHSARYERFGWASARLDDLLNLPASRLTGLLTLSAAPARAGGAWRAWRRDARRHPSPNAGVPEAAFAGALGLRLGGSNRYGDDVEQRAHLGDGRVVTAGDIGGAIVIARRVGAGAAATTSLVALAVPGRSR